MMLPLILDRFKSLFNRLDATRARFGLDRDNDGEVIARNLALQRRLAEEVRDAK